MLHPLAGNRTSVRCLHTRAHPPPTFSSTKGVYCAASSAAQVESAGVVGRQGEASKGYGM